MSKESPIDKYANEKGEFKRKASSFRNWISRDGSSEFPAECNRYHLYVSFACPWAHRTLITRNLKGLENCISVDVVHHCMLTLRGGALARTMPLGLLVTPSMDPSI